MKYSELNASNLTCKFATKVQGLPSQNLLFAKLTGKPVKPMIMKQLESEASDFAQPFVATG